MEQIFLFIVIILLTALYYRQEKINRMLFMISYRTIDRKKFRNFIESIYIEDAIKLKKYFKKHFGDIIDVDNDELFKDVDYSTFEDNKKK